MKKNAIKLRYAMFKSLVDTVTADNLADYLEDILDYRGHFTLFSLPFENVYTGPIVLSDINRIYEAVIEEDDTEDTLYNVSFRFTIDDINYYAYAHMRINYGYAIEDEFIRGTMFITTEPLYYFMTTVSSLTETDALHSFLNEDGLHIVFSENNAVSQLLCNYYIDKIAQ